MSSAPPPANTFSLDAIGYVSSPYAEKFAVPRQPGLVNAAVSQITLVAPYNHPDMVRGLDAFSHLWVTFIFHQTLAQGWRPLVRPPRLGGNSRTGVLATRSTFRPNGLGLSVVQLKKVTADKHGIVIEVVGADLVDGTPIVDIKPYLPYADSHPNAAAGFADAAPAKTMGVRFTDEARQQLTQLSSSYPDLAELVQQVLQQDPRPAYQQDDPNRLYGMTLYNINIQWRVSDGENVVVTLS